jgi:hypothetical protein
MEPEQRITPKQIVACAIAVLTLIGALYVVSDYYQLNIGSTVNNFFQNGTIYNISPDRDNSQANPTATSTVTAPPTATPKPTQQLTSPTPNPSPNPDNNSGGGNSSANNSDGTNKPTPTPTPTPTHPPEKPTIELTPGTTVTGAITATNDSNRYKIVLTEAGRLMLTIPYNDNAPDTLSIRYFDSNNVQIKSESKSLYRPIGNFDSGTYYGRIDLDAGTYYIEIAKFSIYTGGYEMSVDFATY